MSQIFEVGGCVRDRLLGIKSDDIDFTFVLNDLTETPEQGFKRMSDHLKAEKFKIFQETASTSIGSLVPSLYPISFLAITKSAVSPACT